MDSSFTRTRTISPEWKQTPQLCWDSWIRFLFLGFDDGGPTGRPAHFFEVALFLSFLLFFLNLHKHLQRFAQQHFAFNLNKQVLIFFFLDASLESIETTHMGFSTVQVTHYLGKRTVLSCSDISPLRVYSFRKCMIKLLNVHTSARLLLSKIASMFLTNVVHHTTGQCHFLAQLQFAVISF